MLVYVLLRISSLLPDALLPPRGEPIPSSPFLVSLVLLVLRHVFATPHVSFTPPLYVSSLDVAFHLVLASIFVLPLLLFVSRLLPNEPH